MAEPETTDEDLERIERKLHLVMNLASLALSLYVIWDYMKDKPELMVWRQRITDLVHRPIEARSRMRKAQAEVVFEAMQAVSLVEDDEA